MFEKHEKYLLGLRIKGVQKKSNVEVNIKR
jgi:hypothetical protein